MTPKEIEHVQKELLLDIILESTRYTVEPGDDDPIRTEVVDRYKALCRGGSEVNGKSVRERGLEKAGQSHGKLAPGYHRVLVNGVKRTLHESKLVKVPFKCSPTGYRWKLKPEVADASKENC